MTSFGDALCLCFTSYQHIGLPRVPGYPTGTRGNFLLTAATRVLEQKQITANLPNISAIFNRIYGIRISIYRILTHMIVSDIFCFYAYTSQFLNIPVCIKHKSKPMPIYCVVMSDVKQESLANAKVRTTYRPTG